MKKLDKIAGAAVTGIALFLSGSAAVTQVGAAQSYYGDRAYDRGDRSPQLRDLVDRTQSDLREAASLDNRKGDEHERFNDAQGHLSSFDRKLTRGKFDKGELDKSIDKINEILNKNVLQASSRDMLRRDLNDLKFARSRRD